MLLEDNGLLPFLEDWRFIVEPKIQSNTVLVFYSPYLFLSLRYIHWYSIPISNIFAIFLNKTLYELNVAILLTKLEKGLSGVQAMNFGIPRRCKTLWNWTNKTKTQNKKDLDSGVHAGDSGFQVMDLGFQSLNSKAQDSGFQEKKFPNSRFHKQKFLGFWNPDYHWSINSPL